MVHNTRAIIAACPVCASGKTSHQTSADLLNPLPVLRRPWSNIMVDQGPTRLPPSDDHTVIFAILSVFLRQDILCHYPSFPQQQKQGPTGPARITISRHPEGHCLGPRPPVHLLGVVGLLLGSWRFSEPLFQLPLSIHWPDEENKKKKSLENALRCVTTWHPAAWSSYLPWVEYTHNSLVLGGCWVTNLPCSSTRRSRLRSQLFM